MSSPGLSAATALAYDANDPLAAFSAEFHHPFDASGRKLVYLSGHSLGLQPKAAAGYVEQELADWRRLGVLGHHQAERPWIGYHEHVAPALADLAGANVDEVVAMNSLTVNLHLMMVTFFVPRGPRNCILIEQSAFPSDRYAIVSQLKFHGLDPAKHLIEVAPRPGERYLRTDDLLDVIEREASRLALVLLPGVQYLSGQCLDLAPLIERARCGGAHVGVDLAHAMGNTPLQLHDWNADFAVWCSYKYLNAGPGAVGGCFVHQRHGSVDQERRFAGWWGQRKDLRFQMGPKFQPSAGAEGWQISNPPILSTAPLLASLELFKRAGLGRLRAKSVQLTGFLRALLELELRCEVTILTPAEIDAHGCQLSLRIAGNVALARRCHDRLSDAGVIGDWREPDVLRLAPCPLYNSFSDVYAAVHALAAALHA